MTKETVVSVKNLSFKYQDTLILKDINFEIYRGDFVGIIGPNGSGKTTLLKLLVGLLSPNQGSIKLLDTPIQRLNFWNKIGYIPQKVAQFDPRFPVTVEEVVQLGRVGKIGFFRSYSIGDKAAVQQALKTVEMSEYRKTPLSNLSGGQQQRVFIAKALVSEPEILFLDEPTVGIDIESQDSFYQLLCDLNKTQNLTIVIVSHDVDVIINEVNQVLCLNKTLVYHGNPTEFIKKDYLEKLYGKGRKLIIHGH